MNASMTSALDHSDLPWLTRVVDDLDNIFVRLCPGADCIAQFGSSLYGYRLPVVDLDYLVIDSNNSRPLEDELEYLRRLRLGVLSGDMEMRSDFVSADLRNAISNICSDYSTSSATILPALTFGPFPMPPIPKRRLTVYIHLNGPISAAMFGQFCAALPFHAASMLCNHRAVAGSLDFRVDRRYTDWAELWPWINGLDARVSVATEWADVRKAILKLVHMACIADGLLSNDPTEYVRHFLTWYSTEGLEAAVLLSPCPTWGLSDAKALYREIAVMVQRRHEQLLIPRHRTHLLV